MPLSRGKGGGERGAFLSMSYLKLVGVVGCQWSNYLLRMWDRSPVPAACSDDEGWSRCGRRPAVKCDAE